MNFFDIILFGIFALVISYIFVKFNLWVERQALREQADKLQQVMDQSVFVSIEKHEQNGKTTYLVFNLDDDKFLFQAPTPQELIQKAKEKWPNKSVMIHGDQEINSIPDFKIN